MKPVKIYTTSYCPYCVRAKDLLSSLDVAYEEIDVTENDELRQEIIKKHNWMTVPAIFIGEELIGGYDDLNALHATGDLGAKLA